MSFSLRVKEELYKHDKGARHCDMAELSSLFYFSGAYNEKGLGGEEEAVLRLESENEMYVKKCFTLLKKTFNITTYVLTEKKNREKKVYRLEIRKEDGAEKIGNALKGKLLLQRACCRRAYLRGAFLASGSVSDPGKSYHFEIVSKEEERIKLLAGILESFDIASGMTLRKNDHVLYIKDGERIADTLKLMEAPLSLMEFENARIYKDVKNKVNRRVNCETANIEKTVSAAVRQKEAIERAMTLPAYEKLPEAVKEVARLRLSFPDLSLKELGEMCDPRIGKSGVNHRLQKIFDIGAKAE